MRIIFMGTPEFSVPTLELLIENGLNVVAVITATDKMGGRGKKVKLESQVKKFAVSRNLPILQPKNLKNEAFLAELKDLEADLQVVVAFRMLPRKVWDMPTLGTINLHGSLLPKYRGAAPINWAVINGETETGLCTFKLKQEIDTGDLIDCVKVPIEADDTAGVLHDKMKIAGAQLVLNTVLDISKGHFTSIPQDHALATKAPKIFHETCEINCNKPIAEIYNFVRGLSPYPTAWTTYKGKQLNIFECRPFNRKLDIANPGDFLKVNDDLVLITVDGYLRLDLIQLSGKKKMSGRDFLNGQGKGLSEFKEVNS